jgi:TolB protein
MFRPRARNWRGGLFGLWLFAALAPACAQAPVKLLRLKVSDNRRFLVTEDGKPFFWLGDTAWELFHRLNREEAEFFLKTRAEQGFNVIQAVAIAELDGHTERYRFVATRDSRGSYAMVYAPVGRAFKVRMDKIAGPKVKAWWFNPRSGVARASGDFVNKGEREFLPPAPGEMIDWVLVLDDAAANFPPPGQRPNTPGGGLLTGHQLLVTLVRTGDTEIFVVDPETGDARNVSRSPRSEDRYPCWSPDGKRIAFASNRDGPYNLYVMDADGGNVKRLVNSPATCYMPSWQRTADGERIVFGMHGDKPEMAGIRPDGSDLKVLGDGHDPTLAPDGKRICYTGHAKGGVTVFVMDADGANKRQVVKDISKVGATFPNWAPDSKRIVYSFPVGEALELFVVNADGTENRQLTKLGKVSTPAAWSPDGNWISFRSTDERYWSDPKKMQKVYADKPADKRPVWVIRPDGADAHVIECLRFQCAIDGSRASWKPQTPP